MQTPRINVGIVGGTGYTGVELLRLLAMHPHANVCVITSRTEAGTAVNAMFPSLRGQGAIGELRFSDPAKAATPQDALDAALRGSSSTPASGSSTWRPTFV